MKRKLVAALACRNTGSRLYGKPLQKINDEDTILDQIVRALKQMPMIDEIVLGISEGNANLPFIDVARSHGIGHITGDPDDVLERLIQCGRAGQATDVFRVTTECPWFAYEMLPRLWSHHVAENNDITVCDQLPEGLHFEIYSLSALVQAHERGTGRDRSELCSNYARTHPDEFKATVFLPSAGQRRMDLRVTVDYPEDLVIARAIARACRSAMPLVPVRDIVRVLDARADLRALVAPYVSPQPLWAMISQQLEFGADV